MGHFKTTQKILQQLQVWCNKIFADDSDSNASSAELDFLRYSRDYWEFPIKHDTEIVQAKFVFYGPYTRSETSKSGYKFKEDSDILQRYKIIKSRK